MIIRTGVLSATLSCLLLSGCVVYWPQPQPPTPTPTSPLAGLWKLLIQTDQVAPANIQFDQAGNVVYVTFDYGNATVQYTGQQLNAASSFSGGTVTVSYDNRQGTSGFLALGRVQFTGNMNAANTQATGVAVLTGQNIAGGVISTNLGSATLTKY